VKVIRINEQNKGEGKEGEAAARLHRRNEKEEFEEKSKRSF
jgi:hypothetical protein